MMIDWVFCNKCSLKFQQNFKFYLSECGHIFCEKCIDKLKQTKKCILCNKSASCLELSKDMDYTTQMFFWPLENMLKQSLQSLIRKYSYAKKECVNYYNATKKLQTENQLMREMLRSAGYDPPNPFITSTPANNLKSPFGPNLSMMSSIQFTPSQRIYRQEGANSLDFSAHGPSPAQTVPKGYPVPVHREVPKQNPAAATPNFMERLRGKPGYPSLGYPRK